MISPPIFFARFRDKAVFPTARWSGEDNQWGLAHKYQLLFVTESV